MSDPYYRRQNMVDIKAHPGVQLQILPTSRSENNLAPPLHHHDRARSRTPPPPPYRNRSRDPSVERATVEDERREPDRLNWVFRFALFELFLGFTAIAVALGCVALTEHYCPYYTGTWASAIYILHGIIGLAASRGNSNKLLIAHLTFCAVALVATIASIALSVNNWNLMGNPVVHGAGTWNENCIIHGPHYERFDYIRELQNKYDFEACIKRFKIGLSMNTAIILIAAMEGLFTFASGILCCFKICGQQQRGQM